MEESCLCHMSLKGQIIKLEQQIGHWSGKTEFCQNKREGEEVDLCCGLQQRKVWGLVFIEGGRFLRWRYFNTVVG